MLSIFILCNHHEHPSCNSETLYLLKNNTYGYLFSIPGNNHSTFIFFPFLKNFSLFFMLQFLVEQHSTLFLCLDFFFFLRSHINQVMQYLSLYVCLITLSKMSSMLIHLVKKVIFYCFLRLNNISLYPIHILLYLGYFSQYF